MARPEGPMFLERESYLRRRLTDALRLMPVVGIVLFLLPILWGGEGTTAGGLIYLFGTWAVLILLIAVLSRRFVNDHDAEASEQPDQSDDVV